MNCLKINNRDPIEYLSGKGLLRKVSVPCKYIYFFLAFIYICSFSWFIFMFITKFVCFTVCMTLLRYFLFA